MNWKTSESESSISLNGTLQCYIVKDENNQNIAFVNDKETAKMISMLPEAIKLLKEVIDPIIDHTNTNDKISTFLERIL